MFGRSRLPRLGKSKILFQAEAGRRAQQSLLSQGITRSESPLGGLQAWAPMHSLPRRLWIFAGYSVIPLAKVNNELQCSMLFPSHPARTWGALEDLLRQGLSKCVPLRTLGFLRSRSGSKLGLGMRTRVDPAFNPVPGPSSHGFILFNSGFLCQILFEERLCQLEK